ncbi:MAG: dipeptidase [Anaerolineales bacterium]|jgi:acetylornithine deacetylase/succinyl-diaminopimelate desuccinylase-like protein
MENQRTAALQNARDNQDGFLEELKQLIRIPSISTESEHKGDMQHAAEWLAKKLTRLGFDKAQVMPTTGHPVVYAESLAAGDSAPTVLVYGHYDVQPADPLDLWESEAFTPTVRGENLYARGATDMKGPVMASIYALQAISSTGKLPVNVKFLFEGEEEIGSPSLEQFIPENANLLACDLVLNPDTGMLAPGTPTITYALRGLAYFDVYIYGPEHDLHSGLFGGVVHNPAQVLNDLISGMHDDNGRITLPGFYNDVRPLSDEERAELARLPIDENYYKAGAGVSMLWGEPDYSPVERVGARPTLEVNGLLSGFTGEGSKTVLPAKAMAKISCRLVADQVPEKVHQQMLEYMRINAPDTVKYDVKLISKGSPAISNRSSKGVQAMIEAMESVWNVRPIFRREGGTIPVVAMFQEILGVESVNVGFSLPDDNMHGPNEKLHLPTWQIGIESLIHYFFNLVE